MAKLTVDLQKGHIEVDGDEKFVERVYADVRDMILAKLASTPVQPEAAGPSDEAQTTEVEKKTRRRTKSSGPSCAARIDAIKEEDFFKQPKSPSEIREKLKERGTTYESKNVAAALNNLTKSGRLRRFNEDGWKYQNP